MNAANQRRLTPILAVAATVLGVLLLLLFAGIGRAVHWDAPRSLAPLPAVGSATDLPRSLPLQQFALIWEKPLFSPDRKPVMRAADGGSSLGDFELTGVILTPGLRMALLHDKKTNSQVRLREGKSLPDGSVTLLEVRPRSALFDSSAGRTELKLPDGAPIDQPKAGPSADADTPAGAAMMQIQPPGAGVHKNDARGMPPPPPSSSPLDRLRENIQKHRAAQAAANAGVG